MKHLKLISTLKNQTLFYIIHPEKIVPNSPIATDILDSTKSNYLSVCANIIIDIKVVILIISYVFSTYSARVSYNIPYIGGFITYFFLGMGSCLGGLSTKYLIKSFMTYDIDLSYLLESFSRNAFISSVVLKFKGTDLMSLLIHTM